MCMTADEILVDGLIKKVVKEQNQLEVAIGEGMEFTIHGDVKAKTKKSKHLMNNSKVIHSRTRRFPVGVSFYLFILGKIYKFYIL